MTRGFAPPTEMTKSMCRFARAPNQSDQNDRHFAPRGGSGLPAHCTGTLSGRTSTSSSSTCSTVVVAVAAAAVGGGR